MTAAEPDDVVASLLDRDNVGSLLGLQYVEVGPDRVVAAIEAGERHHQPHGVVHGGVYAAVAESLAGVAGTVWVRHNLDDDIVVVGVSNTTDFFRPHRDGRLQAVAEPVHRGRSQQVWQVWFTRADQALVARGQVRLYHVQAARLPRT